MFTGYETGFTAFAVLLLVLWRFFASIEGIVAKIWAKTCVRSYWNRFYGIRHSIYSTFEVFLFRWEVMLPRYVQKRVYVGFETGFTAFAVLFLALWRLFCVDRRYCCQNIGENVFAGFEIGFTAFSILFLALWMFFSVDQRYCCQDTFINVCSLDFKPVLRHSPISF